MVPRSGLFPCIICLSISFLKSSSMILLKNAANKVKDHIFSDKLGAQMQNSFVFQLVFLSAV